MPRPTERMFSRSGGRLGTGGFVICNLLLVISRIARCAIIYSMQNSSEDNSPIEQLKKGLYARNPNSKPHAEPELTPGYVDVKTDWEHKGLDEAFAPVTTVKKYHPALIGILIASVVFFIGASLFAYYIFSRGENVVSSENVNIEIAGPSSISAGEALPVEVVVSNSNSAPIDSVKLRVEYPDGTRKASNTSIGTSRDEWNLDTLDPNVTIRKKLDAVIYGEEGSQVVLGVSVDYKVRGSSATFSKKKEVSLVLSSSPVSVNVDMQKEISSGEPIEAKITVVSNSTSVINNVLLKVDYGFGFFFSGSVPNPLNGNNLWTIGNLAPGERRIITIRGEMKGENGDTKAFKFAVGPASKTNDHLIDTPLVTLVETISIAKSLFTLDVSLGADTGSMTAVEAENDVRVGINWSNSLPIRLSNMEIKAYLYGPFERTSVKTYTGFYKSSENAVIWNRDNAQELVAVEPGASGDFELSVASLPQEALLALGEGQEIKIKVVATGIQTSDATLPQEIHASAEGSIRMNTNLNFSAKSLYSTGAFKNSGPMPPQADKLTTYTVVWTVTNDLNKVSDASVSAFLPVNVNWTGMTGPANESISYDPSTRKILWRIGQVNAGTGLKTLPRIVSFQVAIEPNLTQVGSTPILVGQMSLAGKDSWSGNKISGTRDSVTTLIDSDPMYQKDFEKVR